MKKLKRIKLNQFSKDELEQRAMNALKGGISLAASSCSCSMWSTAQATIRGKLGTSGNGYGSGGESC